MQESFKACQGLYRVVWHIVLLLLRGDCICGPMGILLCVHVGCPIWGPESKILPYIDADLPNNGSSNGQEMKWQLGFLGGFVIRITVLQGLYLGPKWASLNMQVAFLYLPKRTNCRTPSTWKGKRFTLRTGAQLSSTAAYEAVQTAPNALLVRRGEWRSGCP